MKISFKLVLVAFICGLIGSCHIYPNANFESEKVDNLRNGEIVCSKLPHSFDKSDLVGTWKAIYNMGDEDVIYLNSNGTYKQVFENVDTGFYYESVSQNWWLEIRETGFARLHLEGMKRCDDLRSICLREEGGFDPNLEWAIDYCENEVISMPEEVILIVTGNADDSSNEITLRHARLAGSEWVWSFTLQDK